MQNTTVLTPEITFRWDPQKRTLLVTTQQEQYVLNARDALELADLLYHCKAELFSALPNPVSQEISSETP